MCVCDAACACVMQSMRVCDAERPELPQPAPGITAVSRCIWFGGLPANLPEPELMKEVRPMGDVLLISFPPCPGRDEALVTFGAFG